VAAEIVGLRADCDAGGRRGFSQALLGWMFLLGSLHPVLALGWARRTSNMELLTSNAEVKRGEEPWTIKPRLELNL
jgi:hypothetical protein